MALAKYDYIVGYAAIKIMLKVDHALVANVSFLAQGDYNLSTINT